MSKAEFIQCDSCGAIQQQGQHFKEVWVIGDEGPRGHLCQNCMDVARKVFWLIGLRFDDLELYRRGRGIEIYPFHYGEVGDENNQT